MRVRKATANSLDSPTRTQWGTRLLSISQFPQRVEGDQTLSGKSFSIPFGTIEMINIREPSGMSARSQSKKGRGTVIRLDQVCRLDWIESFENRLDRARSKPFSFVSDCCCMYLASNFYHIYASTLPRLHGHIRFWG